MIYSLHIFDRHCECIFHDEYLAGNVQKSLDEAEHAKLIYGVIFSIRNLVNKLRREPASEAPFLAYGTSHYKLHYYETPTGLKFVMVTGSNVATAVVRDVLRGIYSDVYVDWVVKNPLATMPTGPVLVKPKKVKPPPEPVPSPAMITNRAFKESVDRIVRDLIQAHSE